MGLWYLTLFYPLKKMKTCLFVSLFIFKGMKYSEFFQIAMDPCGGMDCFCHCSLCDWSVGHAIF